MSFLPCNYFQNDQGCTDMKASNFDHNATVDDGSCVYQPPVCNGEGEHGYDDATSACMTCSDNTKNGDEEDVDCGGKCAECQKGCKDSSALNYNPDPKVKEDNGVCQYVEVIIDDFQPQMYCDVPSATNYETHDESDGMYY